MLVRATVSALAVRALRWESADLVPPSGSADRALRWELVDLVPHSGSADLALRWELVGLVLRSESVDRHEHSGSAVRALRWESADRALRLGISGSGASLGISGSGASLGISGCGTSNSRNQRVRLTRLLTERTHEISGTEEEEPSASGGGCKSWHSRLAAANSGSMPLLAGGAARGPLSTFANERRSPLTRQYCISRRMRQKRRIYLSRE